MKFFLEENETKIHLYSSDCNGKVTFPCSPDETKTLSNLKTLWDAGKALWQRDAGDRTIYTSTDSSSLLSGNFTTGNASILKRYLRAYDDDDAENIINYVRGIDVDVCLDSDEGTCNSSGHRNRELTIGGETHIWKLGDIVYSTPRILSHFPLNLYHILYQDNTYDSFIQDTYSQKVCSNNPSQTCTQDSDCSGGSCIYKHKDYLFVGANDGMLHCFYLGKVNDKKPTTSEPCLKAELEGTDVAKELWAYIPMNALPYLKYLAYPDYCHIYYVDQRPMLFDASINGTATAAKSKNSWRTILIGEMRFGGSPNPPSNAP